jgi:hypothetical protein
MSSKKICVFVVVIILVAVWFAQFNVAYAEGETTVDTGEVLFS